MASGKSRLDSKLEATGAEFLVLGRLLIDGVQSFIAPMNQRDYDIIATNPDKHRSCRVQVKSRWATDANKHFPISKLDTDFVVFAMLNRGYRYKKAPDGSEARRAPDFYILPIEVVRAHHRVGGMSQIRLRDVPDHEQYLDRWDAIREFLELDQTP